MPREKRFDASALIALGREPSERMHGHSGFLHPQVISGKTAAFRHAYWVLDTSFHPGPLLDDPHHMDHLLKLIIAEFTRKGAASTVDERVATLEHELRELKARFAVLERIAASDQRLEVSFDKELDRLYEELARKGGEIPEDFDFSGALEELS